MDSSNNLDFAGSQFLPNASFNASDGNIDPALLAITPSTSKYLSTNFDQDVDESAQGTVPGAQVRPNGRSPRSHLGAHSLNPRAPPFAPAPQIIPQQPNWQIGNPFAPLENHYEPAIRQLNQQIPSTSELFQNSSYPQQHIVHPDQHHDLGNVLPPYLAGEARISPPMVDAWTQQVYNPAAAIPPFSQAQPTPNPSARQSRRGSLAPSTSTAQSMICCGKRFEKMHQFNHHTRWHGDKDYSCTICNAKFVVRKDLTRHIKIHAERHLMCNIIGCKYHQKGFKRLDHLERHNLKRHPGNLLTPPTTLTGESR